jgi:osomolarity two-component system phosphorelay intermediate protein YPD1
MLNTRAMSSTKRDLKTLSSLGHFLKGSSATLGLTKVKDSCEKIQHYGQMKDEAGMVDEPDEEKCLKLIEETLKTVQEEYAEVEKVLRKFFASPAPAS